MKRKIVLIAVMIAMTGSVFAGSKTEFRDGSPSTGVKGTVTTAEYLNKTSYGVPTGEDQQGSFPPLYAVDMGTANTYTVTLYQGKTRVVSTNTGTAANKLIDSVATFQTVTVVTGDVVLNLTDRTSTTVTAIDSQTQLSLAADIFTATSKSYAVGPNIQQLPQAYTAGLTVSFKAANANTGASTLDINSLGPKAIKKNASEALVAGDIPINAVVTVAYDGTDFQMQSTHIKSNADTLDGYHAGNGSGAIPISNGTVNTNLNADTVDGKNPGSANGIATLTAASLLGQNAPAGFTVGGRTAATIDAGTCATPTALASVTVDLGSVTSGDLALVSAGGLMSGGSAGTFSSAIDKSSGTATVDFLLGTTDGISDSFYSTSAAHTVSNFGLFKVTGSGTLVMRHVLSAPATATYSVNGICVYFLKRQ